MSKEVVGYITSDYLSRGYIPHNLQNMLIRDFVKKFEFQFKLSWTEYKDKAPVVLNSLLQEKFYQGICFFSMEQLIFLPNAALVLKKLKDKNIWVGFALENECFFDDESYNKFEKFLKMKKLIETTRQHPSYL